MSDLGGYKICGRRNSGSFVEAVRVNGIGSRECALDNFVACNPSASPENIICVQDLSTCGITDIKLFENEIDMNSFLSVNNDYEIADNEVDNVHLIYSKKTDNLPITTITMRQE